MKIIYTARKVTLKEEFEERITKRLEKLDKFFSDNAEAQVTVTVEKSYQKVEITVRDGAFTARAERSAITMEEAFDIAADVLTQNIIKNRKKLSTKLQRPLSDYDQIPNVLEFDEHGDEDFDLIREKHFSVKPCSVEEAILQMNMLEHTFYLFRDADTDEINAVYKRKDGSYGVLIPER